MSETKQAETTLPGVPEDVFKAAVDAIAQLRDSEIFIAVGRYAGSVCMYQSYLGVVEQVTADKVFVVYETEDDIIPQVYDKRQFLEGKLPEVGDRLEVFVHVAIVRKEIAEAAESVPDKPVRERPDTVPEGWHVVQ